MTTPTPQWSGEMLDRPEMVEAFSAQLRGAIAEYAEFVQRIRRDAEAMWDADRPEGYSTFESWFRARWVKGPLRDIQEHLEEAAKATFRLEARYRKGRHEFPAARAAAREKKAVQKKGQAAELGSGQYGKRTTSSPPSSPPSSPASFGAAPGQGPGSAGGFMDLVRDQRGERSA